MQKAKRKIVRDSDALMKTLKYLTKVRQGQPTAVTTAAKALRVPGPVMGQRFARLVTKGQAQKLARGLFSSLPAEKGTHANLKAFLADLKGQRSALDSRIARVEDVLGLLHEWEKKH